MANKTTPHPGWLIVMPDGHSYSWHTHTSACPDSGAALCWFEPDPDRRATLTRAGWSVRVGAATELCETTPHRVSA